MKWVTREKARVDRIACPWLIDRFIDREPVFLFVPAGEVMKVAEREQAIPYDVPDVELGITVTNVPLTRSWTSTSSTTLPCVRSPDRARRGHGPAPAHTRISRALRAGYRIPGHEQGRRREHGATVPAYDALYAYCRSKH